MSEEGTIAPEERINIKYRSDTKGGEEFELPLNILVLGDYLGREDEVQLEDRETMKLASKDDFKAAMSQMNLGVDLLVDDKISQDPGGQLRVSLRFRNMKDFGPEGVAAQIPEVQRLMKLREALKALKSPLDNERGFRKRMKELLSDQDVRDRLLQEVGLQPESAE